MRIRKISEFIDTNYCYVDNNIDIYTADFENEYISLTDNAKYKSNETNDIIKNWMRGRDVIVVHMRIHILHFLISILCENI